VDSALGREAFVTTHPICAGLLRVALVFGSVVLPACGRTAGPITAPPESITVSPGFILLVANGDAHQLEAVVRDASGRVVARDVTWQAEGAALTISAAGRVTAVAPVGSGTVWAEVGGVRSNPVHVAVVRLAAGAILVADDQVLGFEEAADTARAGEDVAGASEVDAGPYHTFLVTLRGVDPPPVGSILVGREEAPLAGRVLGVRVDGALVHVTLETVAIDDVFDTIDFDVTLAVPSADLVASGAAEPSAVRRLDHGAVEIDYSLGSDAIRLEGETTKFTFGPFECTAEAMPRFTAGVVVTVRLEPSLDSDVVIRHDKDSDLQFIRFVVRGTLRASLSGALELAAAFTGTVQCRVEILSVRLPIGGPISAFLSPALTFGTGFDIGGSIGVAQFRTGWGGSASATVDLGFEYDSVTGFRAIRDVTTASEAKPLLEFPSGVVEDLRVDVGLAFLATVGVDFRVALPFIEPKKLFEFTFGPRADASLAFVRSQFLDPDYASNYDVKIRYRLAPGETIAKFFEDLMKKFFRGAAPFIGVSPFELSFDQVLAQSPIGTFNLSGTTVDVGSAVRLRVDLTLDTIDFLLTYNVTGVRIYRLRGALSPEIMFDIPVTSVAQRVFETSWTPVSSDVGSHTFAATVLTLLATSALPLEIEADSRRAVVVREDTSEPPGGGEVGTYTARFVSTSRAVGMDAQGRIGLVAVRRGDGAERAAVWDDGVLTYLPPNGAESDCDTQATAMGPEGHVAGMEVCFDTGSAVKRYLLWLGNDVVADLSSFSTPARTESAEEFFPPFLNAVDATGAVVGHATFRDLDAPLEGPDFVRGAVVWSGGSVSWAGVASPGADGVQCPKDHSWAWDVNGSGQLVGWHHGATTCYQAFVFDGATTVAIPKLETTSSALDSNVSEALAVNEAGEVVGFSSVDCDVLYPGHCGNRHAFHWDVGVLTDLHPNDPGWTSSMATALDDRGRIVGFVSDATLNTRRPVIWWGSGEWAFLEDLVRTGDGVNCLHTPVAIDDAGRIVVVGPGGTCLLIPDAAASD
jgi:hypothetical protein